MYEAYPLHWPPGYPRTKIPKRNYNFYQTTFAKERDALLRELKLLEVKDFVISTNIPLRQDGIPYADWERRKITDYGVAVYFTFQNTPSVLCCDAWDLIEDNVHAIVKTIDAMRGIDRWKVSEVLKRTFSGFKSLPESSTLANERVWQMLELNAQPDNSAVIKSNYRRIAKRLHPDAGGNRNEWENFQQAYKQALAAFNETP